MKYKILIPQEEPKQDLEKEETKNNYSEQDMIAAIKYTLNNLFNGKLAGLNSEEIFKQFKNK
jgi:hypothetical protein